jgi:hypothetical protein|tara:strand:+ start:5967 stop:6113 length:147 start_codon:yes stop_codon:yes gene_type:complete
MRNASEEIARKKSRVFAIMINKIKLYKVLKNVLGSIASVFQGVFIDRK